MKNLFRFFAKYGVEFDGENQEKIFVQLSRCKKVDEIDYFILYSEHSGKVTVKLYDIDGNSLASNDEVSTITGYMQNTLPSELNTVFLCDKIAKGEF